MLSHLIKGKKTSQRESSGIRWLRDGTGEGQLVWDWVWTGDRALIILRFLNTSVHSGRGEDEHTHLFQPSPGPSSGAEAGEEGCCSERDGDRKGGPSPGPWASPEVNMEIHPEEPGTNSSARCPAPIPIQEDGLLIRALWSVTKGKGVAASIPKSSG